MQNRPYKIIVLDHEEIIARVVCEELRRSNYDAHHLQSTLEGYDWIIDNQPDLIISDIKFPVMDGFQLLQWLKANPKTSNIPFIYCTVFADLKTAIYSRKLGASDFVAKPYDVVDFLATIARVFKEEWHPDIYSNKSDDSGFEFLKWDQLLELFRLIIDGSADRISEVKTSKGWDVYFIFEHSRKVYGGLFTKPLDYNTLNCFEILNFRDWLDERRIDFGLIMGFYKKDEDVNNLASILNITVLQKNKTEEILKEAQLINNTGIKKAWFENLERIKSLYNSNKQEKLYALLNGIQDLKGGRILLENITYKIDLYKNGIRFNSEAKNRYIWVSQSSLLKIFTKLLVDGIVQKDEFGLDEKEMGCVFQLLSNMPLLKIKEDTIRLRTQI